MNYFEMIAKYDEYLDTEVAIEYREQPLAQDWARVAKVCEELGEAIRELIAYTGQNPRKGIHSTQQKMLEELADVVNTGTLAIQHFTKDPIYTSILLSEKIAACLDRVNR